MNPLKKIDELKYTYENWEEIHLFHIPAGKGNYACGITIDDNGRIYAACAPDEIHVILQNGKSHAIIKTFRGTPFKEVTDVKLDPKEERLFVLDQKNNRVTVFSTGDFSELSAFTLPMQYSIQTQIRGMEIGDDNRLVCTVLEEYRRILYFIDYSGNKMEIASRIEINHSSPHLLDSFLPLQANRGLYFLFSRENALYKLVENEFIKIYQNRNGTCHDFSTDNSYIYICQNFGNYKILKLDLDGKLVYALPYPSLIMPVSIYFKQNRFYLSDRATNEIRILGKKKACAQK